VHPPHQVNRKFLLKAEPWEEPTKKSCQVFFEKLNSKYVKLHLIDEDRSSDEDDEGGEHVLAERVRFKIITRKIDSVTWKEGRGILICSPCI